MEEIGFKFWKYWHYVALTAVTVYFMILAKMSPSHGGGWEPLLFQFLCPYCLEMEEMGSANLQK